MGGNCKGFESEIKQFPILDPKLKDIIHNGRTGGAGGEKNERVGFRVEDPF